jgi:hypothetical protein
MNTTSPSSPLTSVVAASASASALPTPKPTLQIPPITNTIESKSGQSKRCSAGSCKKKLSLTDFPCKCGKICCSLHRAAEEHACTYNYRGDYTNILQSTIGTAIVAKKVDTI